MNKEMREELQRAFEAPIPNQTEKKRFLRTLPRARMSMKMFILTQITFIRKRTLLFSFLLLVPAMIGTCKLNPNTVWIVSALIPFIALLAVSESTRSNRYGMSEFEMSTRFSVKSVLLARLSILGIVDFFILCCLIPLCYFTGKMSLFQTGIYLLVPYLLTANVSLWIVRHVQSREAVYICMGIAFWVSGANVGVRFKAGFIYQASYFYWWVLATIILIVGMMYEIFQTIKQAEEYTWNLLLTD